MRLRPRTSIMPGRQGVGKGRTFEQGARIKSSGRGLNRKVWDTPRHVMGWAVFLKKEKK